MKSKSESGKDGESKAVEFLKQKGWIILVQNYRYKHGELDIVALDRDTMVFVEVKFRKNNDFGYPEDFVDENQMRTIRKTAENYLYKKNWEKDIRFDIISITGDEMPEHFEDVC